MALTRQMLKAMGIEEEKIDQIIESHTETVNGLKELAENYREQAEKVPGLEKQVEELSAKPDNGEEWQRKYDEEHQAFEEFRAEVEKDREQAQKRELYRSLLRDAGVDERRIDSILKVTDLEGLEIEDGALADAEALAEKVKAEWSDFIATKTVKGADVDNPPATPTDAFESMTLEQKMQFANQNPGDAAVKAWLGK